jgi:flagellar basal body rod protein FlgB
VIGEDAMLAGLIGRSTAVSALKEGLDVSTQRTRVTAHRVANATTPGGGFADVLDAATGEAIDLEAEMVALADEQLRFDATARLLQKVYAQVRSSVRER